MIYDLASHKFVFEKPKAFSSTSHRSSGPLSVGGLSSLERMSREESLGGSWARRVPVKALRAIGVLAIVLLLFGWGLSAMQWTILTRNSTLTDAVLTGMITVETVQYSVPRGVEQGYPITLSFTSSGCNLPITLGVPATCLDTPVSNATTTLSQYVVFSLTNPNGSAIILWFSGPQGNLTWDCSSILIVTCEWDPSTAGSILTKGPLFFQVSVPGNYTMHLLGTSCNYGSTCTTSTAVGRGAISISTVTYSRPYYALGLATAVVAGVSLAIAIIAPSISWSRDRNAGRRHDPPRKVPP